MQLHRNYDSYNNPKLPLPICQGMKCTNVRMILIIKPIIIAIMAPNAGKLSDRIQPQKLAAIGIGIIAVALAILTFLTGDTPLYVVIVAMVLQGFGMGLFSSPNMNAIIYSIPPKDAPTASASQATMRTL